MRLTSFKALVPSFFKKREAETTAGGTQPPENAATSNTAAVSSSAADMRSKSAQFNILQKLKRKKNKTPKPMSFSDGLATLQQRYAQQSSSNTAAPRLIGTENPHLVEISSPRTSGATTDEEIRSDSSLKDLFQQSAVTQSEPEDTNIRKISTQISEENSQRLQGLFEDSVAQILQNRNQEAFSNRDRRLLERLFYEQSVKAALQNRNQEVFSGEDLQFLQHAFVESASTFLQDRDERRGAGESLQPPLSKPVTVSAQVKTSDQQLSFNLDPRAPEITNEEEAPPSLSKKSASLSPSLSPNNDNKSSSGDLASTINFGVINPKSKEIRLDRLEMLPMAFQDLLKQSFGQDIDLQETHVKNSLDKNLPGKAVVAELKNTLQRLEILTKEHVTLVADLNAIPDLDDKDIAPKLGVLLGKFITLKLGKYDMQYKDVFVKPDVSIDQLLGEELGENIGQKLGEILNKDSSQKLDEQLNRETSAKGSRASWKRAFMLEGVFKNKISPEVSNDPVQELGKQLGKDIAQILGRQLGKSDAQEFGKQVGIDIAQKLCNQLGNDKAQEPGKQVAKEIAQKLGEILDKNISQKLYEQRLGESVRDCFADAAKICEKYAKKADKGSEEQTKLATLSALFTELKRHHLAAAATPAFEAFSKEEMRKMQRTTPGMVENRSGAAVINTKAISLDLGFGTSKLVKGQAGLEGESVETFLVDDDGDQNRDDKISVNSKAVATLSAAGFLTGKLGGKLKVSAGTNYAETGSFADQAKVFARHKNKDAYINKVWKSASPKAREWKNTYKGVQKYMKWATAANHQSVSAPTHLTEQKIAKGASNTGAIHAFSKMMQEDWADYVKELYPPLDRPMAYAPMSVPAGGAGLRGKEGTSITIVEGTLEASLKAEIPELSKLTKGYLDFSAEGKLAGVGRRREFDIERLKPSHVLLSGAYTKDMRKSLDLWNAIETKSKNDSRLESKLKLYERVKGAVGNVIGSESSANTHHQDTSYDPAFFGPVTDIPATFLNTIRAPESNLEAVAQAVAAQCQQLEQDYATFQQHAGLLHAVSPKGASKKAKARYDALHREAFEKINQSAWGRANGTSASGVKLADLVSSSAKRVEFLADSYDAISTALGGAGTYLEIVKAKVAEMENPPLALVKAIEQADVSYNKVNAALVRAELPMHEDSLHRYNTIAWGAVSSKSEREVQASLSVGISSDLAESLLSMVPYIDANVDLSSAALGISAGLNYKVFTADHPNLTRGGDFREVTLTLKAGAGPLTEAVVTKAAILALERMRKDLGGVELTPEELHVLRDSIKTGLDSVGLESTKGLVLSWKHHKFSKAGDDAWRQQFFRLAEQAKDTLAVSRTIPTPVPGLTVTPGARAIQDLKNVLYEMMGPDLSHHILSLVRLDELRDKAKKKKMAQALSAATSSVATSEAESNTHSRSSTPPPPSSPKGLLAEESSMPLAESARAASGSPSRSAAGSAGTNNKSASDKSASNKDVELLQTASDTTSSGNKLRIHTQDGALVYNEGDYQVVTEGLVRRQQIAEAEANVMAIAQANGAVVADELTLLKEEFDAEPFRKNQFFSTNAILDVVKDYQDFLDWKKNGSPLDKQPNSGFVFYDRAEMQDIAKNARKVDSLAAGKTAFKVETNEAGIEVVRKPPMRASLSEPLTDIVSRDELAAFEQRMQQDLEERQQNDQKARITPDDRARLLLTTEEGKKVFNSYANIVSTYKELTGVATTLLGYEGRMRKEMPKVQTAHRLGVAGKRAGAVLMSAFDGTGLRPSLEAGAEAANTLDQRGYFSPDKLKSYGELPGDNQSLMQTNTWLARHGLEKAENDWDGMHGLIVSLLQHATGRYDKLHAEEAAEYLKKFGTNALISVNMEEVISAIKRDHGEMQVHMISPDSANDGAPAWIGDLGASRKGARSVVIMRSKNIEGKDTFAAIVHRKHAFSSDIPEHLKQLDKAKAVRSALINDSLPNRDSGLTGVEQREAMKIIGTQQRGRISSLMKNASASLADKKREERKVLREMDNAKLKEQVKTAAQLEAGSTRYWREGVKEMKKRDNNKDMLISSAVTRLDEKTGKELRKEIKENISPNSGVLSTARQMASRFKHQSRTAEVMTRLKPAEVEDIARNAKHPKIKKAAEKELDKVQKMQAALEERKKLRTQMQLGRMKNQIHNLTQDMEAIEAEISELTENRRAEGEESPR